MANFPTLRTTHETRFPNGERREVVMEHEAFTISAFEGIDNGCVPIRPEGGGHDGLRFPTSEERGPVALAYMPTSMASGRTVLRSRPSMRARRR